MNGTRHKEKTREKKQQMLCYKFSSFVLTIEALSFCDLD